MKTFRPAGRLALGVCAGVLSFAAVPTEAAVRFVASTGLDANPCTRAAPCRTLQRGVDAASDGDEIQVLDSGEYGPSVNIAKSITISAVGVTATLVNTAAFGRAIQISGSGTTIVLRGLALDGVGAGQIGIIIQGAPATVYVENCRIERFTDDGILVDLSSPRLFVTDTVVRDNTEHGVHVIASNPLLSKLTMDRARIENNGEVGVDFSNTTAMISRTVISGNANGVSQNGGNASIVWTTAENNVFHGFVALGEMTLESSVARGNGGAGIAVSGVARISNSVFTNNGTGIDNSGTVETRGNNTIEGNVTDLTGAALVPLPPT